MSKILLGLILALSVVQYTPLASAKKYSKKSKKKKKGIDNEITNARMRQASGSKNKWSFSGGLGYSGSNITNPFGAERINIYDPLGATGSTALSVSVGVRYRINPNLSLSSGTNISYYRPLRFLHESIDRSFSSYKLDEFNFNFNPNATLSYYGKVLNKQQSFSLSSDLATSTSNKANGYRGSINFNHSVIFNPFKKASLGFYTGIEKNFYKDCKKDNDCQNYLGADIDSVTALSQQSFLAVSIIPFFEYAITPKYSFRTVFNWFAASLRKKRIYEGCKQGDEGCLPTLSEKNKWQASITKSQSVGLGIAYSRDIYIYPNFQFNIKEIKPKLTVAAVSVSFSL
ncbi:MAG: hypothetical protein HAW60_05320 [Bdellovibrionales bacterium]|nr:hypothetical protein [Bdellovibrionales bacterium]